MKKYIIYSGDYDENIGGSISLHRLCDLLNKNNCSAFLWQEKGTILKTNKHFNTPVINTNDLTNFIVIYPEIIAFNPLNAPNVVRWFLNKPGFFTNKIHYGENELYFYFQKIFNIEKINQNLGNKLFIVYFNLETYKQTNYNKRTGSCYMLRKEQNREITHDLKDSIQLDGLSHKEIGKIFNEKKYFYSYDLYTAYTSYASLCGCIPIVIPKKNLSSDQWQPVKELRYGIAYGENEINYAIKTRTKILPLIENLYKESENDTKNFIRKTQHYFNHTFKSDEIIANEKFNELNLNNKKLIIFGTSKAFEKAFETLSKYSIFPDFILDNDKNKSGEYLYKKYKIELPEIILKKRDLDFAICIASMYRDEIYKQVIKYKNVKIVFYITSENDIVILYGR